MKLSIPSRWDMNLLRKLLRIINEPFEVYDSLKILGPYGSGRSKDNLPEITLDEAKVYIDLCKRNNVKFAYLLNAPTTQSKEELIEKGLDDQLNVVCSLNPDSVTISEKWLMEYFHMINKDIPINISTIAAVNIPQKLRQYVHLPIRKVTIQQQFNRNFEGIKELVDFASHYGIDVEVIVNETCLSNCKIRRQHYLSASQLETYSKECTEQSGCNIQKLLHPYLLLDSVWIRPEDLHVYEALGVNRFKLACRTKSPDFLERAAHSYHERKHNVNLIEILGITPPGLDIDPAQLFYLNNQSLNNFLDGYKEASNPNSFCRRKIVELWENYNFKIDMVHGGEYHLVNNELVLKNFGGYLKCQK